MEAPVKVTASQLGIDEGEESLNEVEFDLGNLAAFDRSIIDANTYKDGVDETCRKTATQIFQALTRRVFDLPSEPAPIGRMAELPTPSTLLPREKPVPKPRPPTKWEVFAQKKGIEKKKRSKLVFEEETGEWKRRHGYGKAHDEEAIAVIEAGPHDVPGEDPFTKMRQEKKERVKRNQQSQLANLKSAAKGSGNASLPPTLRLAASLPEKGRGTTEKRNQLQPELKLATRQAGASTASMGKFDRLASGEKMSDRQAVGKKRQRLPVTATQQEHAQQGKMVDSILRKNADDILDVGKAISKFEAATREVGSGHRMKMKGANKKGRLTGGKKPGKAPPPNSAANKGVRVGGKKSGSVKKGGRK